MRVNSLDHKSICKTLNTQIFQGLALKASTLPFEESFLKYQKSQLHVFNLFSIYPSIFIPSLCRPSRHLREPLANRITYKVHLKEAFEGFSTSKFLRFLPGAH